MLKIKKFILYMPGLVMDYGLHKFKSRVAISNVCPFIITSHLCSVFQLCKFFLGSLIAVSLFYLIQNILQASISPIPLLSLWVLFLFLNISLVFVSLFLINNTFIPWYSYHLSIEPCFCGLTFLHLRNDFPAFSSTEEEYCYTRVHNISYFSNNFFPFFNICLTSRMHLPAFRLQWDFLVPGVTTHPII